nr:uncharacterized protein [uncultured bacterium]
MIRLIEGFDACSDDAKYLGKWTAIAASASMASSGGRFNSGYLALTSASTFSRAFDPQPTWVVGFARMTTPTLHPCDILVFADGASEQIVIRNDAAGAIAIDRGSTQLVLSNGGIITPETWAFFEIKVTIADTGGSVLVRINGAEVVAIDNADTKATANASANTITFGGSGNAVAYARYDDIYILDGTGTINDFQGDCRVRTLLPAADDTVQFARSTGAYNYANVDDANPDDDATWNESGTPGDKDLLAFNDLPANPGTIKCIQVSVRARKDDAGARSLRTKVNSGGTEANGAANALGSTYLYYADVFATDPASGAAWAEAAVNSSSYGYESL